MKILKNVYHKIVFSVQSVPPETGGILGGHNGIITIFYMDRGLPASIDQYIPDISCLNSVLSDWQDGGIEFYGMFHSHYPGIDELTVGDIVYINQIFQMMPLKVKSLYFPLIFPSDCMLSFKATREKSGIHIQKDSIQKINSIVEKVL